MQELPITCIVTLVLTLALGTAAPADSAVSELSSKVSELSRRPHSACVSPWGARVL